MRGLRVVAVFAWRDARASRGKFALAALLMGIAAASSFAIRTVTAGLSGGAFDQAREWIAADVMAAYFGPAPTPEQWKEVQALGAESTQVADLAASLSSGRVPDAIPVELKIVDPAVYPYYGRLETRSGRPIQKLLDSNSIVVEPETLETIHIGDTVRIHQAEFVVRDVLVNEPDRYAIPPLPVARVLVSWGGFHRMRGDDAETGFYRVLSRTPRQADRRNYAARLEAIFPDARVIDFTSRTPETAATADWVIPYLNMTGLLALVLGGIAIASAAYFHLLQCTGTIAILRCLGATTRRIMAIYLFEATCLALAGAVAGVSSGGLIEWGLSRLATRIFGFPLHGADHVRAGVETVSLAILVAALATWIPLMRIRDLRASVILRRDVGEVVSIARGRYVFIAALALVALVAFDRRVLPAAIIIWAVGAIAHAAIFVLFRTVRHPWALRHGIRNLHRYRRQSRAAITLMASGVAVIGFAFFSERNLRAYFLDSLPFHNPNLLMLRVDETRASALTDELARLPGVRARPEFSSTAWIALMRAGDSTIDSLRASHPGVWIQRDWPASCSLAQPRSIAIVQGQWWGPGTRSDSVAIDRDLAALLGVRVGSRFEFRVGRTLVDARVAALIRIPPTERAWWREIVVNCETLPRAFYSGAASVAPDRLRPVELLVRERFPDAIVLNLDQLLQRVERTARDAARILKVVGLFATCMAVCMLLVMIRSTRIFRLHEVAVMRASGARNSTLLAIAAAEYLVLGALAGFLGALMAFFATSLLLKGTLGALSRTLDPAVFLIALATPIVAAGVAILGSVSLLRVRVAEILSARRIV